MQRARLSMARYREVYSTVPDLLPCPNQVKKERDNLVKDVPVVETETEFGTNATCSFKDLLRVKITSLMALKALPKEPATLKIKLFGDGTQVTKTYVNFVTFCFIIILPGSQCQSYKDVSNMLLQRGKEAYQPLKNVLGSLLTELEQTKEIIVDGLLFEIKYCFCADYKFILTMLGMKQASAHYSCAYCKKRKHDYSNFIPGRPRTFQDMGTEVEGSVDEPLINFLDDMLDVFPDPLHLKLRVGDQYFKIAVTDVKLLDDIGKINRKQTKQKGTKRKSGQSSLPEHENAANYHMEHFRLYLDSIGITWQYHVDDKTNQIKCGLNGIHHNKMMQHFDVYKACSNMDPTRQRAFKDSYALFGKIVYMLKSLEVSPDELKNLQDTILEWHGHTKVLISSQNFTIYMHIIMEHLVPLIKRHGSIAALANEGVEMFNSVTTTVYHGQSNHRNGSLKQCLENSIREITTATKHGNREPMREQKCTNCHAVGHNKITCSAADQHDNETENANQTPVAISAQVNRRSCPTRLTSGLGQMN